MRNTDYIVSISDGNHNNDMAEVITMKKSVEQQDDIISDIYVPDEMAVQNSETYTCVSARSNDCDILGMSPPILHTNKNVKKRKLHSTSDALESNNPDDDSDCSSLVKRLRNMREKRSRKSYSGSSDLKYEQICSSEFVKSVKVLENAYNVTRVSKIPEIHPSRLHFKPFSKIDSKNDVSSIENEEKPCSTRKDVENKLFSSTLSFEEDKEDDDIFAETKQDTNDVDFIKFEYEQAATSPSFCGFTQEERICSQNLLEQHIQCSQIENEDQDDLDRESDDMLGFTPADIDMSEIVTKIFYFLVEKYCSNDCIGFVKSAGKVDSNKTSTPKITDNRSRFNEVKKMESSVNSRKSRLIGRKSENVCNQLKSIAADDTLELNTNIQKKAENDCELDVVPNSQDYSKVEKSCKFANSAARLIKISESALTKAKQLYEELKDEEIPEVKTESSINITKSLNNDIDFGFATAGGRKLSLSEEAFSNARSAFNEIEKEFPLDSDQQSEVLLPKNMINCGFATAGGRQINVSKTALKKAQQVFSKLDDFEPAQLVTNSPEIDEKPTTNKVSVGFSTAGGRQLKVSKEALSKGKSVFTDIEDEFAPVCGNQPDATDVAISNVKALTTKPKEFGGFATASGKQINVSKTALNKAQQIFSELDDCKSALLDRKSPENDEKPMKNKVSTGFSTAGGRQLKVSEEALSKGKSVFTDIEDATDEAISNVKASTTKPNEFGGFATASGKQINVSKTALNKAQQIFSELDDCKSALLDRKSPENDENPMKNKISTGFSTAGGRQLKVSEEALSKGKSVFTDIEDEFDPVCGKQPKVIDETIPNNKNQTPGLNEICGFATVGGRRIKISNSALTKAQQLYSEIKDPEITETIVEAPMITKKSNINESHAESLSPGTRNLKILQEALSKSKAAYTDIEDAFLSNTPSNKINTETYVIDTATSKKNMDVKSRLSTVDTPPINDNIEPLIVDIPESLTYEDFVDHSFDEIVPSKKRKCEDIDDDTPLRRDTSLKRKRGRYDSDLQGRKLFIEDSNKDTEVELESEDTKKMSSVNIPENTLISEEVDACAAALLEDELRSKEADPWPLCRTLDFNSEANNPKSANPQLPNHADVEGGKNSSLNRSYPGAKPTAGIKENNRRAYSDQMTVPPEIEDESIPEDLNFESQFSEELRDAQVMDKFIVETIKIMEGRLVAASKQDEIIRVKRRTKTTPRDGSLFHLRTSNEKSRISWKQWTEGFAPVHRETFENSQERGISSVTAASAESYSFCCADFYGAKTVRNNIEGIKVGDEASLILDERNCAGAREFERAFLASPGVDPNLIPAGWVRNHYRWIIWKLASVDRVQFNQKTLPRMLTPHRVMLELKYRYDREIYRSQWPPLRRILERNEDASARIILCVASITTETDENFPVKKPDTPNHLGSPLYKMELTDGWYSITASIDIAMVNCIKSGKVKEGTKLMIFGAKALNLDQGCSVLEIPISVSLRIHTNSTRRARWYAKLDFWRSYRGPMSICLKSIKPHGGAICKIVVAIARLYPILFREKLADGEYVFRNARCDEEAARAHEARYQSKMEEIYANAWTELQMASERKRGCGAEKRQHFLAEDTPVGSDREEELREKIASKMRECLPPPRDVTPVMKIRIAEGETHAVITIWSVDRDMTETFVEGSTVAIYNAFASGQRSSELHITAGRSTFVKPEHTRRISYPQRIFTPIMDIGKPGFSPIYGEFDTVGLVTSTGAAPHGMKNFETVNLAFPRTDNDKPSDFLSILFWQGISTHGYSKILTVGSLVACSNLEWRRNTSRSIPTAYCTERSVFSKIPRQKHLMEPYECLRKRIKDPFAYAVACAAVIEEEIAKKSALRTPGQVTPYRPGTSNNRTPGWSPMASPIDVNSTPKIDSRNTSMRRRIARLEGYGEPPELPSIVLNNSSRKVLSDFRSPVVTPVTKS